MKIESRKPTSYRWKTHKVSPETVINFDTYASDGSYVRGHFGMDGRDFMLQLNRAEVHLLVTKLQSILADTKERAMEKFGL